MNPFLLMAAFSYTPGNRNRSTEISFCKPDENIFEWKFAPVLLENPDARTSNGGSFDSAIHGSQHDVWPNHTFPLLIRCLMSTSECFRTLFEAIPITSNVVHIWPYYTLGVNRIGFPTNGSGLGSFLTLLNTKQDVPDFRIQTSDHWAVWLVHCKQWNLQL